MAFETGNNRKLGGRYTASTSIEFVRPNEQTKGDLQRMLAEAAQRTAEMKPKPKESPRGTRV